jgi:hypothetical protein
VSQPTVVPGGVRVVSPRPQILDAQVSLPPQSDISLLKGELPASGFVSASLRVKNASSQTAVRLRCNISGSKEMTLRTGEQNNSGSLQAVSGDNLFLTFDPGIWQAGCVISATMDDKTAGVSKPYTIGKVVRLPKVEKFELTDEKADTNYLGKLTGTDLEVIAKIGWTPDQGVAVTALPVPVGGDTRKQSLQIALPWPPPSPRAPLYLWFRGEAEARATKIRY